MKYKQLIPILVVAALVVIALHPPTLTAQSPSPTITRYPYVQMPAPDTVVVAWTTDLTVVNTLQYGPAIAYASAASDSAPTTAHAVTLSGLAANTVYHYRVVGDVGQPLTGDETFRTAPGPDVSSFSFSVFGDSGTGSANQYAVAGRMLAAPTDFYLHTGDVVYSCGEASNYDPEFFTPYSPTVKSRFLFPSIGNHDRCSATVDAAPYLANFYLPASDPTSPERHYSFDWGNAHIVSLDFDPTYVPFTPGSPAYTWLQHDLAWTKQFWKFVFFHYPVYSSGQHGSTALAQQNLQPLFEQYGVDVVFNGHDHDYERTIPINNANPFGKRIVYVVTGGGGNSLYTVTPQWWTAYAASVFHFVRVDVFGQELTLQAVRSDGFVFDSTTIDRRPASPAPTCGLTGDFDNTGRLDVSDVTALASHLGESTTADNALYDLNRDGQIDNLDLVILAPEWGLRC